MKFSVTTDFSKANKLLAKLNGPAIRQATAAALNDAGFEARKVVQLEMDKSFDRVTPYIRRSIRLKKATAANLTAIVEAEHYGGKGVSPEKILQASIYGGKRGNKGAEKAFRRIGILQNGYSIVPGNACPLDAYGNIKGGFIVQLMSYFAAFSEQGYKANMTDKRKAKLANIGRTASGYKTINGVQYFVTQGKLRGDGKGAHLHPGIWSRSGIHGSTIKPIIMFVRTPKYRARLDFFGKPVQAALDKFNPRLRYHLRKTIEGLS